MRSNGEARNEVVELHLEMQRYLVLLVMSFYRKIGAFQPADGSKVNFFYNPDQLAEKDIPAALASFQKLRGSILVRLAFAIHRFLDRFRALKEKSIHMILWFKNVRSVFYPQWRYAGYSSWVRKEKPLREQAIEQIRQQKNLPRILVLSDSSIKKIDYPAYEIRKLNTEKVDTSEWQGFDIVVCIRSAQLSADALWWIAHSQQKQSWDLFYADSDHLSWGRRQTPHFHCDFSLEYFVVENPAAPLVAFRVSTSPMFQGDVNDLIFAIIKNQGLCHHEQKILSHRQGRDSRTSFNQAAQKFLAKNHPSLQLNATPDGHDILVKEPAQWPKVSIIVPTKDGLHLLGVLMEGVLKQTDYPHFDVLIVNNNSSKPETFEYFKQIQKDPRVRVVDFPQPYNFSKINNFALPQTDGEVVVLMNNDVEVMHSSWLKEMVKHAIRPDVGAVGAKLYFANGSIQHAGVILGIGQVAIHVHTFESRKSKGYLNRLQFAHEFSALTCACFALRREVYLNAGLFSEDLAVAYNDVDFCLKIKEAGYRNIWTPKAELVHKESSTRPPDRRPEYIKRYRMEVDIMRKRWMRYIDNDPAYNRQLSREKSDFRLNWNFDHL